MMLESFNYHMHEPRFTIMTIFLEKNVYIKISDREENVIQEKKRK